MTVCDEFYELSPVTGAPAYTSNPTMKGVVTFNLWQLFEMAELTEVMH